MGVKNMVHYKIQVYSKWIMLHEMQYIKYNLKSLLSDIFPDGLSGDWKTKMIWKKMPGVSPVINFNDNLKCIQVKMIFKPVWSVFSDVVPKSLQKENTNQNSSKKLF